MINIKTRPPMPLPEKTCGSKVSQPRNNDLEEEILRKLLLNDPVDGPVLFGVVNLTIVQTMQLNPNEGLSSMFIFSDQESDEDYEEDEMGATISIKVDLIVSESINWMLVINLPSVASLYNDEFNRNFNNFDESEGEESEDDMPNENVYDFARNSNGHEEENLYEPIDNIKSRDETVLTILSQEIFYNEQLEEISKQFNETTSKYPDLITSHLFGEIEGLLKFHKSLLEKINSCYTMSQLAQLIIKMESNFNIYIADKWLKSRTNPPESRLSGITLPDVNWAKDHLSAYNHILEQSTYQKGTVVECDRPGIADIKLAAHVIKDLIIQCTHIDWLKHIVGFEQLCTAGKFYLKDSFKIKVNSMDRGVANAILMENYIICVSQESNRCFAYFRTNEMSIKKVTSKTLLFENLNNKMKKLRLKAMNNVNVIEKWDREFNDIAINNSVQYR